MSIVTKLFRRWKRIAVLALALIATALISIIAWRVQVESARYDSVQLGMTVHEVEAILGPMDTGITLHFDTSARWSRIGGTIYVNFNKDGNATWKTFSAYGITKHPAKVWTSAEGSSSNPLAPPAP
jgi:hypothetical protein